jgi:cation transport regulator
VPADILRRRGSAAQDLPLRRMEKAPMPYASIDDLPDQVRTHLPTHAQEIYAAAFNSAWTEYAAREPGNHEATAHRIAWAAVKHSYRREGDRWILQ